MFYTICGSITCIQKCTLINYNAHTHIASLFSYNFRVLTLVCVRFYFPTNFVHILLCVYLSRHVVIRLSMQFSLPKRIELRYALSKCEEIRLQFNWVVSLKLESWHGMIRFSMPLNSFPIFLYSTVQCSGAEILWISLEKCSVFCTDNYGISERFPAFLPMSFLFCRNLDQRLLYINFFAFMGQMIFEI